MYLPGCSTHHLSLCQLGDELNSISWSMSMLWFIGCEYKTQWAFPDQCDPNKTWWTAVLLVIPAFLRLVQCLRRYYDSKLTANLHLVNAGKYSSTIVYYFLYFNYRFHGSHRTQDLALWCVFGSIYSIYTSAWDIIMDWSLLRRHARYPWLRNELVFESYWPFYYWAIVTNVIARFGWVIYLLPGSASSVLRIFIIALIEMLRRFQWNFLRLENEHLGNVDMYRISREIPLPYHLRQDRSNDDNDEDEDDTQTKGNPLHVNNIFSRRRRLKEQGQNGELKTDVKKVKGEGGSGPEGSASGSISGSGGDKGKQPVARKLRDHLVPDAGGYAAAGVRLDDVGAAHGAGARDYLPRRHDVDGGVLGLSADSSEVEEEEEDPLPPPPQEEQGTDHADE